MTVSELQNTVDQWIQTTGVRYFDPLTNMAILAEEVGEVARIIAREYGEQSYREGAGHGNLADELADVIWVAVCLANQTGIDLTEAITRNIAKKTARDADRHRKNPKLHNNNE